MTRLTWVGAVARLSINRSAISWLLSLADQGKHLPFALGEHQQQDR
jgi:hypothetical protein